MVRLLLSMACLLGMSVLTHAQVLDAAKIKNTKVVYVAPDKLKKFPTPTLVYLRDKPEHDHLKAEINEKIIYPLLCEGEHPIAVIIVDFCPEILVLGAESERGCQNKDKGKQVIEVQVRRQGGLTFQSLIEWNKDTGFARDAYLMLFQDGYDDYVPKRNCASDSGMIRGDTTTTNNCKSPRSQQTRKSSN